MATGIPPPSSRASTYLVETFYSDLHDKNADSRKRKAQVTDIDTRRMPVADVQVLRDGQRSIKGKKKPSYTVMEPDDAALSDISHLMEMENMGSSSRSVVPKVDRKGKGKKK